MLFSSICIEIQLDYLAQTTPDLQDFVLDGSTNVMESNGTLCPSIAVKRVKHAAEVTKTYILYHEKKEFCPNYWVHERIFLSIKFCNIST